MAVRCGLNVSIQNSRYGNCNINGNHCQAIDQCKTNNICLKNISNILGSHKLTPRCLDCGLIVMLRNFHKYGNSMYCIGNMT
ncbi:hypothetical protein CHUAL_013893 [Chamberlinius hualienensis]